MASKTYSENELLEKIRQSDTEAFKVIYYQYYNDLIRFAYSRTNCMEAAKDYTQETFQKFWQNRNKVIIKTSLKSYLFRIIHNLIIDDYHKKSREKKYIKDQSSELVKISNSDYADKLDIDHAVNMLPEKLKTVFILKCFKDLRYKDIAEICGISIKTVESRMAKAYIILRERLLQ